MLFGSLSMIIIDVRFVISYFLENIHHLLYWMIWTQFELPLIDILSCDVLSVAKPKKVIVFFNVVCISLSSRVELFLMDKKDLIMWEWWMSYKHGLFWVFGSYFGKLLCLIVWFMPVFLLLCFNFTCFESFTNFDFASPRYMNRMMVLRPLQPKRKQATHKDTQFK